MKVYITIKVSSFCLQELTVSLKSRLRSREPKVYCLTSVWYPSTSGFMESILVLSNVNMFLTTKVFTFSLMLEK